MGQTFMAVSPMTSHARDVRTRYYCRRSCFKYT